jgi:RHS repeat-associated protein
MGGSIVRRGLSFALALTFLVPPNIAFAQDVPPGDLAGPQAQPTTEDLQALDGVDVDPRSGGLIYKRTDLVVGEAEQAYSFHRTYRPWGGDRLNLGLSWATSLDAHLDVHAKKQRASFQDETGQRHFFTRKKDRLVCVTGNRAILRELADGYSLSSLGDGREYRFNTKGYLINRSGPTSLRIEFSYDEQDRLSEVKGPWGKVAVERDKKGRLTALRAPGDVVVRYERDAKGNLSKVVRQHEHESYRYDSARRMVGLAGDLGRIAYDAAGRVIRLSGPGIRPLKVRYLKAKGEWSHGTILSRGTKSETFRFSQDEEKVERTDPQGGVSLSVFDARSRLVRFVAPDKTELRQTYDGSGRILTRVTPEGTTRYHYESKVTDRPTRITLADGRQARYRYDVRGNILEATTPDRATTRYSYDAAGRLNRLVDPRGAVTTFSRDARGNVLEIDEQGVGKTSFLRGTSGRLLKVKRPDGRVVTVERGTRGKRFRIADARGVVQEVNFDARRRVTRLQDEHGNDFRYTYSPQGELTKIANHGQHVMGFRYDASGDVDRIVDANGNQTTILRQGNRTVVTDASGGARTSVRDSVGRLLEEVRGETKIRYEYDKQGRLAARHTPRGVERFRYDAHGRMLGLAGPDGGYTMTYDEAGRLAGMTNTTIGKTVRYLYDEAGDRVGIKLPWGEVRYRYDVQGRLTGVTLPDGKSVEIAVHPDGRRKSIRYPNGVQTQFFYEKARLKAVVTKKGEGKDAVQLDRRVYGYDDAGRVAWIEDALKQRTTYSHDAQGRLLEAKGPQGTVRYRYDKAGNRIAIERDGKTTKAEIGPGNRLLKQGDERFTYTATGAVATKTSAAGTTHYTYDHDDRLQKVKRPDGTTVRYGYAPNGTRLWRDEGDGKIHFLHDLADVVGELDADGKLVTSFVHGLGDDDVLAANHDKGWYFYHYDLVRSVTSITSADGSVAARYRYSAFGENLEAKGQAVAWNPYRYTSRTFDASADLYHYRARHYAPEQARFTSPDPLGLSGGVNLYAYVGNDPLRFNDPQGLWPKWLDRAYEKTTSWVGEKVVAPVSNAVSTAATWTHENVLKPVGSAIATTARNTWAFGTGFVKGTWGGIKGIYNMVRHPIVTFNAIYSAIENWDETKEAIKAKWEEYKDAFHNDPERFWEMTGYLTAEIALSVAGTKGLDKLAKAGTLARLGNNAARVAKVVANPVVQRTARVGGTLGKTFPRVARTVRSAKVLSRARNLELARRAAQGGNILRRVPRRIGYVGKDLWNGARMAVTKPGAMALYSGGRMTRMAGALVASTGRGLWKAAKYGTVPVLGVFNDQITDAVNAYENREAALKDVRKKSQRFLKDVGDLTPEELTKRLAALGGTYGQYRNRLMKPVHDEDLRLDAALKELDEKVAKGEIPDSALDSRLNSLLEEYGRRRHNTLVEIYDRNREEPHDMFNPSLNRTIAFQDEIDLLEAAKKKVRSPEGQRLIEARQKDLTELMGYEYDLFKRGDHDVLIEGIAGVPRDPSGEAGLPAPDGATNLDGMNFNPGMLDSMEDFMDLPSETGERR